MFGKKKILKNKKKDFDKFKNYLFKLSKQINQNKLSLNMFIICFKN